MQSNAQDAQPRAEATVLVTARVHDIQVVYADSQDMIGVCTAYQVLPAIQ
jgi:hypothetical protein